jgi:hypothetical protein
MMAKYFSAKRAAELEAGREQVRKQFNDLRKKFFLRTYKNKQGAEFAKHGFSRRLETLMRAIDLAF